jgi:hypothetical protein
MGTKLFAEALPTMLGLAIGAAGPVVLQVGGFRYEPTDGAAYEPTDGATVDPYPESPACANAKLLGRARAAASTIVVSFMRCPSCCLDKRQPHRLFDRSIKIFFKRDRSRQTVHISQGDLLPPARCTIWMGQNLLHKPIGVSVAFFPNIASLTRGYNVLSSPRRDQIPAMEEFYPLAITAAPDRSASSAPVESVRAATASAP